MATQRSDAEGQLDSSAVRVDALAEFTTRPDVEPAARVHRGVQGWGTENRLIISRFLMRRVVGLIRMQVRDAQISEIGPLAMIWYRGWQDAHARILPVELARHRTLESFADRLRVALANVRVVGPPDVPLGFCMLRGAELYQFYVSSEARGSGVAAALMGDAEARLGESGVDTAWLACAIGNDRAARFYEKCGWHRAGIVSEHLKVANGTFPLDVWRYEKSLRRAE